MAFSKSCFVVLMMLWTIVCAAQEAPPPDRCFEFQPVGKDTIYGIETKSGVVFTFNASRSASGRVLGYTSSEAQDGFTQIYARCGSFSLQVIDENLIVVVDSLSLKAKVVKDGSRSQLGKNFNNMAVVPN